jgi:MoaD family protein
MITVRFFGMVRLILKEKSISINADNIDDMLKAISGQYAAIDYKTLKNCLMFVNGKNIAELKLLKTALSDGDIIDIFSPAAGG